MEPESELRSAQRILLAGPSGSGKSTLGKSLSQLLHLPYTELDSLFHGANWAKRPTFEADVAELIAQQKWITEWQYPAVRQLLLSRAQVIIWLLYPRSLVLSRVIRRTVGRAIRRQELWNGNIEQPLYTFFTDRDHIVRWSWKTYPLFQQSLSQMRQEHPDITNIVLTHPRDAARVLRDLAALV